MALLAIGFVVALGTSCLAQSGVAMPKIEIGVGQAKGPEQVSSSIQILLILTVLSLAPALLIMLTSFTRIIIVLSFTRSALGSPQVPPNTVLIGLGSFLTFFTMAPVLQRVNDSALQPYVKHQISFDQAVQTPPARSRDSCSSRPGQATSDCSSRYRTAPGLRPSATSSMHVLIPAFLISELKTAFTIGFVIFIPFLVIDMVVSVTLMSMGMMMLPPVLIACPSRYCFSSWSTAGTSSRVRLP